MVINYILLILYPIGLVCILFSLSGMLNNLIEVFIVNIKIIYSVYAPSGITLNGAASRESFSKGKGAVASGNAGRASSAACLGAGASGTAGSGSGSGAGASGSTATAPESTVPPSPNMRIPTFWPSATDAQGNSTHVTYGELPMSDHLGSFTISDPNHIGIRGFRPGNNRPYCEELARVLETVYNRHEGHDIMKNMPLLDSKAQLFIIS